MAKPFFLRNHGCPECGGNVKWLAVECPYCSHQVCFSDRCDWADGWAVMILLVATALLGSLIGLFITQFPPPLAAMAIAVSVTFWYVLSPQSRGSEPSAAH